MTPTDLSMLRAALYYTSKYRWYLFPLRPGTKQPFAGVGVYQATIDPKQICDWWTNYPDANIGLACGQSEIVAIDRDVYRDSYAGRGFLTTAECRTATDLTPNGGEHLIFRMPVGEMFGNATGTLPQGIDVRGQGGYILLPPSRLRSGGRYQWKAGYGPHELPPQPLPDKLYKVLKAAQECNDYYVGFDPGRAQKPDLSHWRLSGRILNLIYAPRPRGQRSEADQSVITALVTNGATDTEIRNVFEFYPIGLEGKCADKGRLGDRYLAHSIARARQYVQGVSR